MLNDATDDTETRKE